MIVSSGGPHVRKLVLKSTNNTQQYTRDEGEGSYIRPGRGRAFSSTPRHGRTVEGVFHIGEVATRVNYFHGLPVVVNWLKEIISATCDRARF